MIVGMSSASPTCCNRSATRASPVAGQPVDRDTGLLDDICPDGEHRAVQSRLVELWGDIEQVLHLDLAGVDEIRDHRARGREPAEGDLLPVARAEVAHAAEQQPRPPVAGLPCLAQHRGGGAHVYRSLDELQRPHPGAPLAVVAALTPSRRSPPHRAPRWTSSTPGRWVLTCLVFLQGGPGVGFDGADGAGVHAGAGRQVGAEQLAEGVDWEALGSRRPRPRPASWCLQADRDGGHDARDHNGHARGARVPIMGTAGPEPAPKGPRARR
jgi:hypothetical protein